MKRHTRGALLSIVVASAAVAIGVAFATWALAAGGVSNAGFESGLAPWVRVTPAPQRADVVGVEDGEYPVYSQMGLTVQPYYGTKMLRIGTPRLITDTQRRGTTTVQQSDFTATGSVVRIAFRAFSWEHRGQDTVTIDIKDAGGTSVGVLDPPVNVKQSSDSTRTFDALPITMPMDVGNPVDLVDTGWVAVNITGLTQGATYTISYQVATTHDDGLATWCYFDEGEYPPPVAAFKYAPGPYTETPENPHEGDIIGLYGDFSYSPDGRYGTAISAYDWTIAGEGKSDSFGSKAINYIVIANEGSYELGLTVTDDDGLQDSTAQTITVKNWPARVNALNAEAIPGRAASLIARFIDPGWLDNHTASWSIGGAATSSDSATADHIPYVSTGVAQGTATVPADTAPDTTLTGQVDIFDGVDNGSDVVTLTVVPDDPMRREPADDAIASAPRLQSDGMYLSYIQSAGDVDFYEVRLPDDTELPYNTEVLVNLKGLPADYDLVLMSQVPTGTEYQFKDAPGMYAPGMNAPGMYAPGMYAPGMYAPGMFAPGMYAPGMYAPGMFAPGMYAPGMNAPGMHAPVMQSPGMYAPGMYAPGMYAPFDTAPGMNAPGMYAPGMHAPGMYAPGMHAPGMFAPGMFAPTPLEGFALSDMSYTGLTNGSSQGGDFAVSELGIDLSAENLQVAGFSANDGLGDEAVLARVDQVYQKMYVAVVGATGAHSSEPYTLQIETSQPLNNLYIWNAGVVTPPLVEDGSTSPEITPLPAGETATTLFVTQWERIAATYSPEEQASLQAQLNAFALRPEIKGAILSVPSALYDEWDANPVSVTAANDVCEDIRALVQEQLLANPTIKYVVMVGSDRIVPYRRVTDQAIIGNERYYADTGAYLKANSPLLASMMTRNNLTDDYYVDVEPTPFQGRALYIPDLAVGRLVETPAEVENQLQAFRDAGGVLQPETSLVTGLDFMMDGSQAVADTFWLANLDPATLISDTWSRSNLVTDWLGLRPGIANVNAHFAHWGVISASGYLASQDSQAWDPSEYLMSTEVGAAVTPTGAAALKNKLAFSMGCHAGLNVPDEDAFPLDPSFGIDAALDLPQAMAQQGAVFMGSTGYGLGESDGIAGTEQLIGNLSRTLLKGDTSVGDALLEAKQQFLLGQGVLSVYDEKSSIEFCLYGLPQYRIQSVGVPQTGEAAQSLDSPMSASALEAASFTGTPPSNLALHVIDRGVTLDTLHTYTVHSTDSGDYFAADDDVQATTPRPIQPRVTRDVEATTSDWVHGVLLLGGNFKTLGDFNPKNAQVTTEWNTPMTEFQVSESGWWPSPISGVNSAQSATDITQRLVVIPAEFKPYAPSQATVVGWERLYGDLSVELLRSSDNDDFRGPTVAAVTLPSDDPTKMTVNVKATDDSGVSRIVIAYTVVSPTGDGTIESISVTPDDPFAVMYTLTVPIPAGATVEDISALVQTADGAGNVANVTGTSVEPHALDVQLTAEPTELNSEAPTQFTVRIPGFNTSVVRPVTWSLDFGDGETAGDVLEGDLAVDADGVPYFTVSHQYASDAAPVTATVSITDMAGGSGSATCLLTPPPKNVVWVATTGSDANPGSEARPFRHIAYALARLAASQFPTSTVNVQPGTYSEDVSLIGGVNLVSVGGASATTISGTGTGPVLTAAYGAAPHEATVEGFTITGGFTTAEGGGIRVQGTSPAVYDCVVTGNRAANGGGIAVIGGSASLVLTRFETNTATGSGGAVWAGSGSAVSGVQSSFSGNKAQGGSGGAVAVNGASLSALLCSFTANESPVGGAIGLSGSASAVALQQSELASNKASGDGGAAYLTGGSQVNLSYCTVGSNTAGRNGGGLAASDSTIALSKTTFTLNVANGSGGALWSLRGSATLNACTLMSNRAQSMGGGIYDSYAQLRVTNSIIARNTLPTNTKTYGGGAYVQGVQPFFVNDTIVDNNAYAWGGIGSPDVKSVLFNCIVASTTTSATNNLHRALIGYSFLAFPTKSQFVDYGPGTVKSSNGIAGFVNPTGTNPDYHLVPTSPCVDTGGYTWNGLTAPATDMDGIVRPQGAGYDMGAYERAK